MIYLCYTRKVNSILLLLNIKKMKKIHFTFSLLLPIVIFSSCVSSLYPISTNENDFIFNEVLFGHWVDKDMQTQVIIKKVEGKKYGLTVIDKIKDPGGNNGEISDTSYFLGFMIQLNGQQYVDCSLDSNQPQYGCMGKNTRSALLPLHFIYKISLVNNDQISITAMNLDSLKKFIAMHPNTVKYAEPNDLLLTNAAAGLQKNILSNKEASFVFSESGILNRVK